MARTISAIDVKRLVLAAILRNYPESYDIETTETLSDGEYRAAVNAVLRGLEGSISEIKSSCLDRLTNPSQEA